MVERVNIKIPCRDWQGYYISRRYEDLRGIKSAQICVISGKNLNVENLEILGKYFTFYHLTTYS
jgi:hypothetical protein